MLNDDQKAQLAAPLSMAHVKKNQRGFDYVESWHAEAEANRIFGYDGWSSVIIEVKMVSEKPRKLSSGDGWSVTYTAIVRITAGGQTRDGAGAGHGMDKDLGLAHESAIKEAASDAEKRAFKTFGNPFGLALYDKTRENVVAAGAAPAASQERPSGLMRKSSAQAKRDGDHEAILAELAACKTEPALDDWFSGFNERTAALPQSWLTPLMDEVEKRRNAILDAIAERV